MTDHPTSVPDQSLLASEIIQQGTVVQHVLRDRIPSVVAIVRACQGMAPRTWVATGCGDSLFAGLCAEYWFADACGLPLRAIHALEFSRYLYRTVDERSVVFALSYSGNTARVVEAAVAAKSRGATVIGITANAQSRLVEISDYWLPNDAVDERSNCRTGSFQAACLLLRLFAGYLAHESGEVPSLGPLDRLPASVDQMAGACRETVQRIVGLLPEAATITYIGGGYAYGMAQYGAAKLYEAATIPAHVSELEQFVHCEIFPITRQSCVVIVAPRGASYTRAVEVAQGLRRLDAVTVGISDDPAFAGYCSHFIALPGGWTEDCTPFLTAVPLQHFALAWARRRGENPDLVSNKAVNRPLIEQSVQYTADDYASIEESNRRS